MRQIVYCTPMKRRRFFIIIIIKYWKSTPICLFQCDFYMNWSSCFWRSSLFTCPLRFVVQYSVEFILMSLLSHIFYPFCSNLLLVSRNASLLIWLAFDTTMSKIKLIWNKRIFFAVMMENVPSSFIISNLFQNKFPKPVINFAGLYLYNMMTTYVWVI
jgi:hypothetical protein